MPKDSVELVNARVLLQVENVILMSAAIALSGKRNNNFISFNYVDFLIDLQRMHFQEFICFIVFFG